MKFSQDDREAFEKASATIVAAVEARNGGRYGDVAQQILEFKWGYLDGDLGTWDPADIDEILFGLYPAKVMTDDAGIAEIAPGAAALFRHLATLVPRHRPPLGEIATVISRSATQIVAEMHNEANWSFGKRMWSTATSEGVDFDDRDQVSAWVEGFNQRTFEERGAILGELPGERSLTGLVGPLPPVSLAPVDVLTAAAEAAPMVRWLRGLVEFVGAKRPLTDRGNLKLADGKALVPLLRTGDKVDELYHGEVIKTRSTEDMPNLDYTFRVALAANVLQHVGQSVRPGINVAWAAPDQVLDLVYGAYLGMVGGIGPTVHRYGKDHYNFGWYGEGLDQQIPAMLIELYRVGEPIEIEDLADEAWAGLMDQYDLDHVEESTLAFHQDGVEHSTRRIFDRLNELGVAEIVGEANTMTPYGFTERSGGAARLTELGMWAVQRMASGLTSAPVVGALADESATDLLAAAADLADDIATAEIDAWVAARGNVVAAEQLCAVLPATGETARGLAFRALLRIGADAAPAVATLAVHEQTEAFVTVWRVDTLLAEPDEMLRVGDPAGWARLLHTVIELWGPQAAVAAWADQVAGPPGIDAMLSSAWRVRGEQTETVLSAIGAHHSDKHVAKAARKALFKLRSSR